MLDVVLGHGNSAQTVSTCMSGVHDDHAWHVAGFEMDLSLAMQVRAGLSQFGAVLMPCESAPGSQPGALPQASKAHCAAGWHRRRLHKRHGQKYHVTIVPNLVSQAGLDVLCSDGATDLAIIDPISSFESEVWAVETTCKPRYYLINNVNLPGHAGWAKEWLLQRGRFTELASGTLIDYNAENNGQKLHGTRAMGSIYKLRGWVLLRRQ